MACDACINVSAGEESDDKVMQYGYAMKVLVVLGSARFLHVGAGAGTI